MQLVKPTAATFERSCSNEALRDAHTVKFVYDGGAVVAKFYNGPYFLYERRWHMGIVT